MELAEADLDALTRAALKDHPEPRRESRVDMFFLAPLHILFRSSWSLYEAAQLEL